MRTVRFLASPTNPRLFRLEGAGRWMDYGDAWLCTHDLMHHKAGDTGRIEEELATYGVESWLDGGVSQEGWSPIGFDTISGPLCDSYRDTKHLNRFVVAEPPKFEHTLPETQVEQMVAAVNSGFADVASTVMERYFDLYDEDMPQSVVDQLVSEENQARAVRWIAYGFVTAQQRYPDPAAAAACFYSVYRFFRLIFSMGWLGDSPKSTAPKSFRLDFDEAALSLRPHHPRLQRLWKEVLSTKG